MRVRVRVRMGCKVGGRVRHDVHKIGLDVVEQPLVMRDEDDGVVGRAESVDAYARRSQTESACGGWRVGDGVWGTRTSRPRMSRHRMVQRCNVPCHLSVKFAWPYTMYHQSRIRGERAGCAWLR